MVMDSANSHCPKETLRWRPSVTASKGGADRFMSTPTLCRYMRVVTHETRHQMGVAAGEYTASMIRGLLEEHTEINAMFAAAPSQDEFLEALASQTDVAWDRIRAFHMDEYLGLPQGMKPRLSGYLDSHLFGKLPFLEVHRILGSTEEDPREACDRYAELLRKHPLHIVCLGIGENGHIAFNDPLEADFVDPRAVKIVKLDPLCRHQQVNDRSFSSLEAVPTDAISATVPTLMSAEKVVCVVPGSAKRRAVQSALEGAISTDCPASVLRRHSNVAFFLDKESAAGIMKNEGG